MKSTPKPKSNKVESISLILKHGIVKGSKKHGKIQLLLKLRRAKYGVGTHGSAGFQRKTLGTTGDRHESEHVVGYNVYAESYDRKVGEGKVIELQGLAYLEVKSLHRAHPGTGAGNAANQYRNIQRSILDEGGSKTVSSAIQFNQLEYAHLPDSVKNNVDSDDQVIAEISYEAMVRNGNGISYYDGSNHKLFHLDQVQKAELLLAFEVRRTGQWPTAERIKEVLTACKLEPIVKIVNNKEVVL